MGDINWEAGADLSYLKELVAYWHDTYRRRRHEAALNQFAHFKPEVDDIGIHFIHERGNQSAAGRRVLSMSLYPISRDRFSDRPPRIGTIFRVNDLWAQLMTDKLGCQRGVSCRL